MKVGREKFSYCVHGTLMHYKTKKIWVEAYCLGHFFVGNTTMSYVVSRYIWFGLKWCTINIKYGLKLYCLVNDQKSIKEKLINSIQLSQHNREIAGSNFFLMFLDKFKTICFQCGGL